MNNNERDPHSQDEMLSPNVTFTKIMKFEEYIAETTKQLADWYKENPWIRGIVQLLPAGIGSALDITLVTKIDNIAKRRAYTFFEHLRAGNITLTEKDVLNDSFLHAYFSTSTYAVRTRREEKIRLFANLFLTYCKNRRFEEDTDTYEEYLKILDDLNYKEFQILCLLYDFETSPKYEEWRGGHALVLADHFWNDFCARIVEELNISKDEVPGILERLNRTGLYQTFIGSFVEYAGDRGHLTPNFYSFLTALDIQSEGKNESQ